VSAGRGAPDAESGRVYVVLFGVGAEPADRGFAVLYLCGEYGVLAEAIVDAGDGVASGEKSGGASAVFTSRLPASAVDPDDQGQRLGVVGSGGSLRQVQVELVALVAAWDVFDVTGDCHVVGQGLCGAWSSVLLSACGLSCGFRGVVFEEGLEPLLRHYLGADGIWVDTVAGEDVGVTLLCRGPEVGAGCEAGDVAFEQLGEGEALVADFGLHGVLVDVHCYEDEACAVLLEQAGVFLDCVGALFDALGVLGVSDSFGARAEDPLEGLLCQDDYGLVGGLLEPGAEYLEPGLQGGAGFDVHPFCDGGAASGGGDYCEYALAVEVPVELLLEEAGPLERGGVSVDDDGFGGVVEDFDLFGCGGLGRTGREIDGGADEYCKGDCAGCDEYVFACLVHNGLLTD